jgi:CRP/FNR family transcriptional regulator, cyclic AMP receptor protein
MRARSSSGGSSGGGVKKRKASSLLEAASLSAIELFRDLPAGTRRVLVRRSVVREFPAEHVFFRPGETGELLFILEKGHVQTYRGAGAKKLIIADLKPPAVFGEMGCIGQGMYQCSAVTMEASRIRSIERAGLEHLLDASPGFTRRLLDLVSKRFFHVLNDLESTSFRLLIPRLANLLIEHAEGDSIRGMTHREIAEHLRVYRESATAALGEMRAAGIIAVERKRIRILDRGRLERAARE